MVVFPVTSQFTDQRHWWRDLTGAEPDSSLQRRTDREESGQFDERLLVVSIDPLRIQWAATLPLDPERIATEGGLLLQPFVQSQVWFQQLMNRWLENCPPVNRIAFIANAVQPVANHEEGYTRLNRYLRHVEVFPDSSDFFYRINRRNASTTGIDRLEINRVSTWSVANVSTQMTARLPGAEQTMRLNERFYLAAELDVNTIHEFPGPLPHERVPELFGELVTLAVDNLTRGDARE
jgi:hypothetical protein